MRAYRTSAFLLLGAALAVSFAAYSAAHSLENSARGKLAAPKASAPSDEAPASYVLKGATIHTMTEQGTFVGSVVVENGKISAVGERVVEPQGATVLDVTGCTLMPGLIDSKSVLWLTSAARDEAGSRGALDILDGVNPFAEDWREVARQGVTSVYVQPSNRGAFGGQGAVLRVAPGRSVNDVVVKEAVAAQAAMGIAGGSARSRAAEYQRFQRALQAVKDGEDPPSLGGGNNNNQQPQGGGGRGRRGRIGSVDVGDTQQRGRGRFGRGGGGGGRAATQPDKTKQLLQAVLDGETSLRMEVHQEDMVEAALKLADEFDIHIVLDGVSSPGTALDAISRRQAQVVIGPVWETGNTPEYRSDRKADWLASVTSATYRWALGTFATEPRASRMLRVQAAAAVSEGLDPDLVLRSVTVEAAEILGVGGTVGSLAPGMQADIAVFAGSPLDPSTPTRLVMSRGEIVHQSNSAPQVVAPQASVTLPAELPNAYVIRSNRILDESGQFSAGEMFVRGGRIEAMGSSVNAPQGTEVFDIGDAVLAPGLVVAHTYLGQESMLTDDTESDASQLMAADVIDTSSDAAKSFLAGGFVNVAVAPSSVNASSGVVAHVRLGGKQPVMADDIAGKFVLSGSARSTDRYPSSLVGQISFLDKLFSGATPQTRLYVPEAVAAAIVAKRRANVDAVVTGGRKSLIAAETATEAEAALKLISTHQLSGSILGPIDSEELLPQFAQLGVAMIARPVDANDYDAYVEMLAAAAGAGVPVSFAGENAQEIRMTAAMAVNAGMPSDAALRGLTSAAASAVGMSSSTARLTPGAPADFVVWTGNPLDLCSKAVCVVVQGEVEQSAPAMGRLAD